ncbi:hypothetical protein BVJ53_14530 [Lacticaseibacillus chiayiensis]|uniref:Uncharacterized protein n=1 Tax=Lacticaseibacillus chiayiensis TaxID=2100821 RepID=A0A4Q1TFW1_9LACO|nr:hypothetical protein BVJ53_14530 [Lacticaseibacillus chiayiensis]RXT55683.1 hypothetical protein CHT97_12160 [Lacticaseibacillus chiayiensis]
MPRRSNRRLFGAQPCKQHSDRALSLMLLGDFETAGFWLKAPEIAEFGMATNPSGKNSFPYKNALWRNRNCLFRKI